MAPKKKHSWFVKNRWLSENEIMHSDIHCCLIQCHGGSEEYQKGEHVPGRAEQGEGRKGGIKGGRERFLWCVFPRGQKGGAGLLP